MAANATLARQRAARLACTCPDPLSPLRLGLNLQQQGKGGAGLRGSELRAMMMVLSEHQSVPPLHSLILSPP